MNFVHWLGLVTMLIMLCKVELCNNNAVCKGNIMISSAIWRKQAQLNFQKTIEIALHRMMMNKFFLTHTPFVICTCVTWKMYALSAYQISIVFFHVYCHISCMSMLSTACKRGSGKYQEISLLHSHLVFPAKHRETEDCSSFAQSFG